MIGLITCDGSNNVQYKKFNGNKIALVKRLKTLQKYARYLENKYQGIGVIIFVDARFEWVVDDPIWLMREINCRNIIQCEQGYKTDDYIIKLLEIMPKRLIAISRDKFREYTIPEEARKRKWRLEPFIRGEKEIVPGLEVEIKRWNRSYKNHKIEKYIQPSLEVVQ